MTADESTLRADLERLPEDLRFLRLEISSPGGLQRLPFVSRRSSFDLGPSGWQAAYLDDGTVLFESGAESRQVRQGERFCLDAVRARVIDLRTLLPYALFLLGESGIERHWELGLGRHAIGRPGKRKNDISFHHKSVSRCHAVLELDSRRASIIAESGALTAVNGRTLGPGESITLNHGDRLQLGEHRLLWHKEPELPDNQGRFRMRLLGGFELWKDGIRLTLKTDKGRLILARLALNDHSPVAIPPLLEDLWPERPPTRQRKNLSHTLKTLQSELEVDEELFDRLVQRTPEHLRMEGDLFEDIDIWHLRAKQSPSSRTLPETHRGPLLPEHDEPWLLTPRRQLFLSWLSTVEAQDFPPPEQARILESIGRTLGAVLFEEFVYERCFALARKLGQPELIALWFPDFRVRLLRETGDSPSDQLKQMAEI